MEQVVNVRNVAVIVPLPLGGEAIVEANGSLRTTDEHAQSLLEQPENWAAPAKAESPKNDNKEKDSSK
ncbi:MAG: hypothetical protein ACRDQZ_05360 [Mycobacteriales bacterium]